MLALLVRLTGCHTSTVKTLLLGTNDNARRRDNDERGPAKSWTRIVFLRRRGVGPLCLHRIVLELERIHGWVKEGISLV